eukprot:SAG11_NODE_9485_length_907_cov_1.347772_1_plen_242_part_10
MALLAQQLQMSAMEAQAWLADTVGLPQYVPNFERHHIDGGCLADLSVRELDAELDIRPWAHRRHIFLAFRGAASLKDPSALASTQPPTTVTHQLLSAQPVDAAPLAQQNNTTAAPQPAARKGAVKWRKGEWAVHNGRTCQLTRNPFRGAAVGGHRRSKLCSRLARRGAGARRPGAEAALRGRDGERAGQRRRCGLRCAARSRPALRSAAGSPKTCEPVVARRWVLRCCAWWWRCRRSELRPA